MRKEPKAFEQLTIYDDLADPPAWTKLVQPDGRIVWAPNGAMAVEQDAILENLYYLGIDFQYATAIPGSDYVRNAIRHSGNRHFFTLDFKNAYGQADLVLLAQKLSAHGFHDPVSDPNRIYEHLVSYSSPPEGSGIVQGGSSSPMLFNIYCLDLDHQLGDYCESKGITYSRYLDDMTFSIPDSGFATHSRIGKNTRREIREIIARHNLELNEAKTRVRDIKDAPVIVTGVQINRFGKIQIPTSYLRQKRQELQQLAGSMASPQEILNYASGLNGLLVQTSDRTMTEDEKNLYLAVQDVIFQFGSFNA